MSEYLKHHPLAHDLPQYRDTIHDLKMSDENFSRLLGEYEVLDKKIVRIEQRIELMDDLDLDNLKMERVALKDTLTELLQNAS